MSSSGGDKRTITVVFGLFRVRGLTLCTTRLCLALPGTREAKEKESCHYDSMIRILCFIYTPSSTYMYKTRVYVVRRTIRSLSRQRSDRRRGIKKYYIVFSHFRSVFSREFHTKCSATRYASIVDARTSRNVCAIMTTTYAIYRFHRCTDEKIG